MGKIHTQLFRISHNSILMRFGAIQILIERKKTNVCFITKVYDVMSREMNCEMYERDVGKGNLFSFTLFKNDYLRRSLLIISPIRFYL